MGATRLEERFRATGARTAHIEDEALAFAADFTRLCVRTLALMTPSDAQRDALCESVGARTGWSRDSLDELLGLALEPEFRDGFREDELWAFSERFGPDAAQALRDRDESLDLGGFATRYGPSEGLLLLDALFGIAGADGRVSLRDVRRMEEAARQLGVDEILVTALLQKHDHRMAAGDIRYPLVGDRMVIGRAIGCEIALADPQVARRHAELIRVSDGWRVIDLGSGRPTVLNGRAVLASPVVDGDNLQIGPYALQFANDEIVAYGERRFSSLSVRNLSRKIGDTVLLDDLSFTMFSGEVIAVVGPSGCGKTTLLNAISGVAPADEGTVTFDGEDFHAQVRLNPALVGAVPQDDLVHAELTVEESLYYSGRLRFGPDVSDAEVWVQVDRVLHELELNQIRHNRVGDTLKRGISGGQRKRVNLGQELMTRATRVLFLDEPTSGLDPRASQDIARLVRQLADRGRLVFLVTHDLTPEIIAQVDHLLVLAPGGRLAFFGPPSAATEWFEVATPDAVFNRFGDRAPEDWGTLYRDSSAARKFVATREHLLGIEGLSIGASTVPQPVASTRLIQIRALLSRYGRVKLRDRTGLFVLGVQPPLLAVVMWIVFPNPTTPLMFMLALSCLWFGMSAAVRELISDRVIWRREQRIGVGVFPYLTSKVLILGALVAAQCAVFSGLMFWMLGLADYGYSMPLLGGISLLTGWVGLSLGMLVSASWTSSEAAVGTLPLLIIPQITFSSIMVSVRSMGEAAQFFSWFTVQRYAFDALIKCGDELAYFKYGQWQRQRVRGFLYELGLKGSSDANDMGLTLIELALIMSGFTVAFFAMTASVLWWRQRRQ